MAYTITQAYSAATPTWDIPVSLQYQNSRSDDGTYQRQTSDWDSYFKAGNGLIPTSGVKRNHAKPESIDDLVGLEKEAKHFKSVLTNYLSGEGKYLTDYLASQGKAAKLDGVGSMKLPKNAVAAVLKYGQNGEHGQFMVSNGSGKGFDARVDDFAQNYLLPKEWAKDYVLMHEMMHAAGYHSESSCEDAVEKFCSKMEEKTAGQQKEKYGLLRKVAGSRKMGQEKHSGNDIYN